MSNLTDVIEFFQNRKPDRPFRPIIGKDGRKRHPICKHLMSNKCILTYYLDGKKKVWVHM